MAEWKKIIVSGSGVSQLSNDSGFLTSYGSVEQHSDVTDAGSGIIISAAERSKLTNIAAGAEVNVDTNITVSEGTTTVAINSSTGGDDSIAAATQALAGVMTAADKTKLDSIETSATADQTDAQIRAAVEAASDSNVFTDADHTKLNGISVSADVTDSTTVAAAGALMDSEVTNLAQVKAFDETDYATAAQGGLAASAVQPSDSVTTLSDVSSVGSGAIITAAERSAIGALNIFTGSLDSNFATDAELSAVSGALASDISAIDTAVPAIVSSGGSPSFNSGITKSEVLSILNVEDGADVTDQANVTAAGALMDSEVTDLAGIKGVSISTLQEKPSEGAFVGGDKTKLDGIETNADVTDTANVTSAGALMDSEVTNLAQVKAFDTTDYATAAQGSKADAALPKAGGAMTGAITTNSTFDGRDVATDGGKLDGIESGATADQTDAQIRAAVEAASDSNVFTNADHTKLNGIEASADVTDKTNVVAALGQNLGTTLTIGDSTDTITIGNDLVVTGDLTVSGDTTTVDVANLNVTDQFINLNDGGSSADGGIVVEGAGVSYGWDNSAGRWAFDAAGATEGQTSITSDAYAVAAVTTDDANYRKNGNIRVTAGEIFIYTE